MSAETPSTRKVRKITVTSLRTTRAKLLAAQEFLDRVFIGSEHSAPEIRLDQQAALITCSLTSLGGSNVLRNFSSLQLAKEVRYEFSVTLGEAVRRGDSWRGWDPPIVRSNQMNQALFEQDEDLARRFTRQRDSQFTKKTAFWK